MKKKIFQKKRIIVKKKIKKIQILKIKLIYQKKMKRKKVIIIKLIQKMKVFYFHINHIEMKMMKMK